MTATAKNSTSLWPRTVLVIGVLGLLAVVVFGASHPLLTTAAAPTVSGGSDSPVGDASAWGLVALGAAAVVLLLGVVRRRRRSPENKRAMVLPPGPLARLVGLLIALLVPATLAMAMWWAFRIQPTTGTSTVPSSTPQIASPQPASPSTTIDGTGNAIWISVLLAVLAAVVAVAAFLHRRRARASAPGAALEADQAEVLAEAVGAGQRALREQNTDREAILACVAAMEQEFARHGVARGRSDTASEHLGRAAQAQLITVGGVSELLQVFHRARFSDHPVGAADRQTAERVLAVVSTQLGART